MPILDSIGSVKAYGWGSLTFDSDYELITTTVLTGNTASVTFSNLGDYSSTYKHLQIRFTGRTTRSANSDVLAMRLNGDTGSNYAYHQLNGNGSIVESDAGTSQAQMRAGRITAASAAASAFGTGVVDILDPYSSSKNTTIRSLTGYSIASEPIVTLFSSFFNNTASITQITLFGLFNDLVSGSRFSLYGVK
jgi:hypothetical protein